MKNIRVIPKDPEVTCANCDGPECSWAHLRYHDAGMGMKCEDVFGAPLCRHCHDYIDGRAAHDRTGHAHPDGAQNDFEWRYRVLRIGIKLLLDKGYLTRG